jgi:hypothetical protein
MADLVFPTIMHIDYVRIYQKAGQENITCDPPGYPTTEYIKNHPVAYMNPNLTVRIPSLKRRCSANFLLVVECCELFVAEKYFDWMLSNVLSGTRLVEESSFIMYKIIYCVYFAEYAWN